MASKVYDVKQRSYLFALDVVKCLDRASSDYISQTMGKQLLRSATSIGANIVEAQAASSKRDFINFYTHALKSANETKFWLGLLKDTGKAPSEATGLLEEAIELSNILASSILTMKGKNKF